MNKQERKQHQKNQRKGRVRARVSGTSERPRLAVSRSLQFVFAQLIDDTTGKTLVSIHSKSLKKEGKKVDIAKQVGEELAKKAKEQGIKSIVFDRGGSAYHGRVKALAEGARSGGLQF